MPSSSRVTFSLLISLVAAGMLATSGCKKKVEPPPPPPPPQPVEIRLQVTSISPSTVPPQVATPAKVFGSAFAGSPDVHFVGPGGENRGSEVRLLDSNTLQVMIPALAAGSYDVRVTNGDGEQSTLRQGLTVRNLELSCNSATVNFAFDDASLTSASRSTLDGHMGCYQSEASSLRVEGHCDERGTVDYNTALGQRRAESVKSHLVSGGVSAGKISTTSYGEERPVATGHDESSWAQNRRAEIRASN